MTYTIEQYRDSNTGRYRFAELSDAAKETALQQYAQDLHGDWHESVCDDFKAIAGILGFDRIDISYSGFWSQGDGASFTGQWSYRKGMARDLRAYAPKDATLHAIARDLQEYARKSFYRATDTVYRISSRYSHENTVRAESDELTDIVRRLCQWLYSALEREYEYQTSAKMLAEMSDANSWEYDARGVLA